MLNNQQAAIIRAKVERRIEAPFTISIVMSRRIFTTSFFAFLSPLVLEGFQNVTRQT